MNLRDLEYLIALEEYKHFGQAAHHCFVSQPTLSGQIKKLEEELGVTLIDRSIPRKVLFTEAGHRVLEHAHRMMAEKNAIVNLGNLLKDPTQGEIHVAAIPTIAPYFFPLVVDSWKKEYPHLKFHLYEKKTADMVEEMASGELDLGVLALPIGAKDLIEIPLYQESFHLTLTKDHPRAKAKLAQPSWMQEERLLLLEDGHCFRGQALEVCKSLGARERNEFRGTGLETLKQMVLMGEGATLVPELTMYHWKAQHDNLGFLSFPKPIPVREVGLLYRHGNLRQEVFEVMGKLAKKSVTKILKRKKEVDTKVLPL